MIAWLRALARRGWPVMRLRWVLLGTLVFVAALPGIAALGLRVYENALVRRTEAELVAQAAAVAATAALLWPEARGGTVRGEIVASPAAGEYERTATQIDLRSSPVLAPRPAARPAAPPQANALAVARRIAPVVAETRAATLASILLLDRQGVLLNGVEAGGSLAALPEVRSALAGRAATVLRRNAAYGRIAPLDWVSRGTAIRLHHARPVVVRGKVVGAVLVSRSPAALFRGMWEDRGKIAAGTAGIFALLVLLTLVLARAIVRPVEKLSEAARALAAGQPAQPLRPTLEVREIRSLFDDFEAMAASIARRSRYLRDFAASLSHEFKTPLAALRGGIELLQDHGSAMTPAQRDGFLANMAGDADRLTMLISRLMKLAQADMHGAGAPERGDLARVAEALAQRTSGAAFTVAIDVPPGIPPLAMEDAALETVLATLLENARQAGATRLALSAQAEAGWCAVTLADNGPGIPPGDRDRVFDPFFTTKREDGGTGLGLSIARAMVEGRRGSLDLAAGGREGATFVLRLPLAAPFARPAS